jgi:hypothetical protein
MHALLLHSRPSGRLLSRLCSWESPWQVLLGRFYARTRVHNGGPKHPKRDLLVTCIPRGPLDRAEVERSGGATLALYDRILDIVTTWVDGLDPAKAGNAKKAQTPQVIQAVHPRMRGERPSEPSPVLIASGSSPHARGTLDQIHSLVNDQRFIPACAGNAALARRPWRLRSVHPRMRGERPEGTLCMAAAIGSSPHARGRLTITARRETVTNNASNCGH